MKRIVFYSWQSDLPNKTNRGLIQKALEDAVKAIVSDETVTVEPVIDRDTQGVAGSPDIASTIFAKIVASDVFVADISLITDTDAKRPSPNPNVLIELGYALRDLGHERVVLVFNQAYGDIQDLPFDLRMRRVVPYNIGPDEENKALIKKQFGGHLEAMIRSALDINFEHKEGATPLISAIENVQPNKIVLLRRELDSILGKIVSNQPKRHTEGGGVEDLTKSIESTQEAVAEFSKIIEIIAIMKDGDLALEVNRWFGKLFEYYNNPKGTEGRTSTADHDYYKFLGHELYVTLIAFLLREKQWQIIKEISTDPIPLKYIMRENGPGNIEWSSASAHLPLLLDESPKKQRLSLHADILNERHTSGGLSSILPIEEFSSADFFLFFLGEIHAEEWEEGFFKWRPWSILYMKGTPAFIKNAKYRKYAQDLADSLGCPNVDKFKERLKSRHAVVNKLFTGGFWHTEISDSDIDNIGSI